MPKSGSDGGNRHDHRGRPGGQHVAAPAARGPSRVARRQRESAEHLALGFGAFLQHFTQRVAVEQVAEFQIFAEHVEALVPAEPLELGRRVRRAACRW